MAAHRELGTNLNDMDRRVHYTRNGDVRIAFQVVGDGPIDMVYTAGIWSNLDVMWEEPRWARYLSRLASFSRLSLSACEAWDCPIEGRSRPWSRYRWTTSAP